MAIVRRAAIGGAAAYVVRRGDSERGALYLKVATLDGKARLWGPAPASLDAATAEGDLSAHLDPQGVPERDADAYLARQCEYDGDLWIVEIEDRAGRSFLGE